MQDALFIQFDLGSPQREVTGLCFLHDFVLSTTLINCIQSGINLHRRSKYWDFGVTFISLLWREHNGLKNLCPLN